MKLVLWSVVMVLLILVGLMGVYGIQDTLRVMAEMSLSTQDTARLKVLLNPRDVRKVSVRGCL